jgi:hypothetical protein
MHWFGSSKRDVFLLTQMEPGTRQHQGKTTPKHWQMRDYHRMCLQLSHGEQSATEAQSWRLKKTKQTSNLVECAVLLYSEASASAW